MNHRPISLFILSIALVACSYSPPNTADINIACSGVENYVDTKTIVLTNTQQTGVEINPVEDMQTMMGFGAIISTEPALSIYQQYANSMESWAKRLEIALISANRDKLLAESASILEQEINSLESQCLENGWKFSND